MQTKSIYLNPRVVFTIFLLLVVAMFFCLNRVAQEQRKLNRLELKDSTSSRGVSDHYRAIDYGNP